MTRRILLLALLCLALPAHAQQSDTELLRVALDAYAQGLETDDDDARVAHFRRAELGFAELTARGHHGADLHANLANAALQTGRLGTAVLHYRRALAHAPDHARARQNLDWARTRLPEWVPRPEASGVLDTFFFWRRTLTHDQRAASAALAFALASALVALGLRLGNPTPRNLAVLPAIAWLSLLGSLWFEPTAMRRDEAVVTADDVIGRAADAERAPALLPDRLPPGTEVRIVERRSPWLRIRLANGRDVWIGRSGATPVAEGG